MGDAIRDCRYPRGSGGTRSWCHRPHPAVPADGSWPPAATYVASGAVFSRCRRAATRPAILIGN